MPAKPATSFTYRIEKPDAFTSYVFGVIFDLLGLHGVETTNADPAIYYGSQANAPVAALVIPSRSTDVLWPDVLSGAGPPDLSSLVFPFDVVNAIGRFLTDAVNRDAAEEHFDEHQRLRFRDSFQGRHRVGGLPVVNIYAKTLQQWLARHFELESVPAWPAGRRCAIGLSHDVDRLSRWSTTLVWPPYARHLGRYENLMVGRQRWWQARQLLRHPLVDDFALFRSVMAFEAACGCASTFFFASRNRFQEHASLLDVPYDIRSARMRRLCADLLDGGFGVGLHASYRAYESGDRFIAERGILKSVSGGKVEGLRHHFWHVGRDVEATLAMHETAGFEYDSSLAFNEHLGFRRSVAWPYHPWNHALGRPLRTLQLPVFCMDGNVFYEQTSVEHGVAQIVALVEQIKAVGGLGVIDWHSDTAAAATLGYEHWGRAYEALVRSLRSDSEIWTTNLESIVDWYDSRHRRLSQGPRVTSARVS